MIYRIEANKPNPSGKTVVTKFIHRTGIGNQIFEISAGLSVARTLGIDFEWVWLDNDKRDFGLEHFGIAKTPWWDVPVAAHSLGQGSAETIARACKLVSDSPETKIGICSPFQAEECFENVADEVRALFKLEPLAIDVPEGSYPVAMQVRRGDYVNHPRLDVCTPRYFLKAMEWMRGAVTSAHFFIVSDDPDWCRETFGSAPDVTVMPAQSPIDGLRTMAACKAHIISNSSYGWWGAWLAESGPVVAPDPWYKKPNHYGNWNPVPARWHRIMAPAALTPKREPFRTPEPPSIERAIVYPWKQSSAKWEELRYSIRSVEENFSDKECPIIIIGTSRPAFMQNKGRIKFVDEWTYAEAVLRGTQMAKKVLWMNDDIVLLKPCGWQDFETARYSGVIHVEQALKWMQEHKNRWFQGLGRAVVALSEHGTEPARNFSTHIPYVYANDMALEIFRTFGIWEKIPLETLYFNHFKTPCEHIGGFKSREPSDTATVLNYNDALLPGLKQFIMERFPAPGPNEFYYNALQFA
jgi:hypothetical protein